MAEIPVIQTQTTRPTRRLPPWLKRPALGQDDFGATKKIVADSCVATVCQEARCPNLSECWAKRHATFMILGDKCTRRCAFCAVATARPDPPDADEPQRLAQAIGRLELAHAVVTAVARDDLADEGAGHFAECVRAIRASGCGTTIEVLPADFHARPQCIEVLCQAEPDLYNHNIEMVERLSPKFRPQANYARSLDVLRIVKRIDPKMLTKSGLMVGLGESVDELRRTFADLREAGCDVLTIGQYLAPTLDSHPPVERFYAPPEFAELAETARSLGFVSVAAGPFVRSSYNANEVFENTKRAMASDA